MPPVAEKRGVAFHAFMVLFTIFGIPIIIALPFVFSGYVGRW